MFKELAPLLRHRAVLFPVSRPPRLWPSRSLSTPGLAVASRRTLVGSGSGSQLIASTRSVRSNWLSASAIRITGRLLAA